MHYRTRLFFYIDGQHGEDSDSRIATAYSVFEGSRERESLHHCCDFGEPAKPSIQIPTFASWPSMPFPRQLFLYSFSPLLSSYFIFLLFYLTPFSILQSISFLELTIHSHSLGHSLSVSINLLLLSRLLTFTPLHFLQSLKSHS